MAGTLSFVTRDIWRHGCYMLDAYNIKVDIKERVCDDLD